jgi:DNA-binding transcriptional MerR regulator
MKTDPIPAELQNKKWLSKTAGGFSNTPQRTVQSWAEKNIISPDMHDTEEGTGDRRLYSTRNCIEIGIAKSLSKKGIAANRIKSAIRFLREENRLSKHLSEDYFYLIVQDVPIGKVKKGADVTAFSFSEKDKTSEKRNKNLLKNWFHTTTFFSEDQIVIVDANKIAKKVIKNILKNI